MAARTRYSARPGPTAQVIGSITDQAAYRAAQKLRGRVQANMIAKGRIDTGRMIKGTQVRVIARAKLGTAYQVYSDMPYTRFQEFGTKAHGPRTAKVMSWIPKGGGNRVFAMWVRGVTPGNFYRDALRDARTSDFEP